jgi:hypothetical protein
MARTAEWPVRTCGGSLLLHLEELEYAAVRSKCDWWHQPISWLNKSMLISFSQDA